MQTQVTLTLCTVPHSAKPFLFLFYLSYLSAVPAMILCYLGFGRATSIGTDITLASATVSDLVARSQTLEPGRDYFEDVTGFIAFNLSKSVVHTVNEYPIDPADSLYYGLTNPVIDSVYGEETVDYSDLHVSEVPLFSTSQPALFPDVISQWTVAPIFQSTSKCLQSVPPVHVTCMLANKIIGWAVASDTSSVCRAMSSSTCTVWGQTNQSLSIYYPSPLNFTTPVTSSFTGMLAKKPPSNIVEAIRRRYNADGWPIDMDTINYPSGMPDLWVQVIPDIVELVEEAKEEFNIFTYIAIALMGLTTVLVLVPFVLDVYADSLVMQLIKEQKIVNQENENEREKRRERSRQVENIMAENN